MENQYKMSPIPSPLPHESFSIFNSYSGSEIIIDDSDNSNIIQMDLDDDNNSLPFTVMSEPEEVKLQDGDADVFDDEDAMNKFLIPPSSPSAEEHIMALSIQSPMSLLSPDATTTTTNTTVTATATRFEKSEVGKHYDPDLPDLGNSDDTEEVINLNCSDSNSSLIKTGQGQDIELISKVTLPPFRTLRKNNYAGSTFKEITLSDGSPYYEIDEATESNSPYERAIVEEIVKTFQTPSYLLPLKSQHPLAYQPQAQYHHHRRDHVNTAVFSNDIRSGLVENENIPHYRHHHPQQLQFQSYPSNFSGSGKSLNMTAVSENPDHNLNTMNSYRFRHHGHGHNLGYGHHGNILNETGNASRIGDVNPWLSPSLSRASSSSQVVSVRSRFEINAHTYYYHENEQRHSQSENYCDIFDLNKWPRCPAPDNSKQQNPSISFNSSSKRSSNIGPAFAFEQQTCPECCPGQGAPCDCGWPNCTETSEACYCSMETGCWPTSRYGLSSHGFDEIHPAISSGNQARRSSRPKTNISSSTNPNFEPWCPCGCYEEAAAASELQRQQQIQRLSSAGPGGSGFRLHSQIPAAAGRSIAQKEPGESQQFTFGPFPQKSSYWTYQQEHQQRMEQSQQIRTRSGSGNRISPTQVRSTATQGNKEQNKGRIIYGGSYPRPVNYITSNSKSGLIGRPQHIQEWKSLHTSALSYDQRKLSIYSQTDQQQLLNETQHQQNSRLPVCNQRDKDWELKNDSNFMQWSVQLQRGTSIPRLDEQQTTYGPKCPNLYSPNQRQPHESDTTTTQSQSSLSSLDLWSTSSNSAPALQTAPSPSSTSPSTTSAPVPTPTNTSGSIPNHTPSLPNDPLRTESTDTPNPSTTSSVFS